MTKAEIRRDMKNQRKQIPEEERRQWDAIIRQRLWQREEYLHCQKLFCYISFGSEPDTNHIIQQALVENKIVYVPKVEGTNNMEFYRINELEGLHISSFGIPEPASEEEKRYRSQEHRKAVMKPLMLLPGLAFDQFGNRIGYGAGYYDRYLHQYQPESFYKIALCYDFQLLELIESREYDIAADAILTPTRSIQCR